MALTTINSGGVKDDSIVNADIKSDAAIAGSKVAPDFGSQNIITTGNVGIGTGSGTSTPLHVVGSDNTTTLLVESTDADASVGPIIELFRNSGSPADNDAIGRIDFKCDDDAGNASSFARIAVTALDVSNGSEDAKIDFIAATNDTFTPTMSITGQKVGIGTDSPSNKLHCVSSDYQTARFESSAADANGTYIEMYANSSSPADNDILGIVSFRGNNSAAEQMAYAHVRAIATDVTDGTEDGAILFHTRSNGSFGERLRIDSNGNVSIGGIAPVPTDPAYNKALLHIHQTQSGTYGSELHLTNNTTGSTATDGMFLSMWTDNDVYFTNQEAGDINFTTNGHEALKIQSNKNVKITDGNLIFDTSGHGIDFSATSDGAGTDSSELLNDYEEGTWSPIFTDHATSGNSASSYGSQLGWYTKIGNLVNLQMRVSNAVFSSFNTSHATYIKNLPYVVQQSSDRLTTGTALVSNCNLDSDTMTVGVICNSSTGSGNSWFRLFQAKDNTAWVSIKISQWTSGDNEILVNFSYRTDAV